MSTVVQKTKMKSRSAFFWLDRYIVREAVEKLPIHHREILKKRFNENLAIYEIASLFNLKCKDVETYLAQGLKRLREFCMSDPAFSRNWLAGAEI